MTDQPDADELEEAIAAASRRLETAAGPMPTETRAGDAVLYCANHPSVETILRCNRCGKPICTRCAVRTPVGYRCKECLGRQQAAFYTGRLGDSFLGGAIALVLGGLAAALMVALGAWFFALILGPTIGIGIAEVVRQAVRRRRSRTLWVAVVGGLVLGAVASLLLFSGGLSLWRLLTLGLYLFLAAGAAGARLR